MIGVTNRSDIYLTLEKRVLSRLNAQYIYYSKLEAINICKYCLYKLFLHSPSRCSADDGISEMYRKQYHRDLAELFGEFTIAVGSESTIDLTAEQGSPTRIRFEELFDSSCDTVAPRKQISYRNGADLDLYSFQWQLIRPGKALGLIDMMLQWGRDLR
jgi:hypothetical protein